MRRCPYCAEEIQEEAIICRYCSKRVKRSPYRIIITAVIIAALAVFCATHQREISRTAYSVKIFFEEARNGCMDLYKTIRMLPESLRAIKEYKNKVESINEVINMSPETLKREQGDQ